MSRAVVAVASMSVALSVALPVQATHEVDHRYVVLGYVRDAAGRPVSRRIVLVVREKTGFGYEARTDGDGFYFVVLHVHDEDVLEPLRVTAGPATLRVETRFNPLDPRTPRGTSIEIVDGMARERPEEFAAALKRYLRK